MNLFKTVQSHYGALKHSADIVKEISHKNCKLDLFLSRLFLRVSYNDYINLGFYYRPWGIRKAYILDDLTPAVKYNHSNSKEIIVDKNNALDEIRPYIRRKFFLTTDLTFEQLVELAATGNTIFYKPLNGSGGHGVKKIDLSKVNSIRELYAEIRTWPQGLLEETIIQHSEMKRLCPNVVQTIRFCVFKHEDGPRLLFTTLRTPSNLKAVVDNGSAGGIYANIDTETGRIRTNAFCTISCQTDLKNLDSRLFTDEGLAVHPITGTRFKDFQIPYFQEAKKMVLEMAANLELDGKRLLGFDIAITPDGPEVVEVNKERPGMVDLWQVACKSEPQRAAMARIFS